MNIAEYFESVKDRSLADSFVMDFKILKYVDRSNNGHMRARVIFSDDSNLEFSEFIEQTTNDEIRLVTYSYHWSDKNGNPIRRWDNALHYPDLENFPHHIHDDGTDKITPGTPTNIFAILDEIAKTINRE
jgi:murein L,D-transpeptidase YcbB/YkuD